MKYPKGGEGSDFFCVEIFHYQYKIMLGGGNKTSSRKWCVSNGDCACSIGTVCVSWKPYLSTTNYVRGGFPIMQFLVPPPPTHPPLQKMTKLKMTRYQIFPLEFHLYSSARIYSRRRAASRIIVCALCWQCVCYRKPISKSNKFRGRRAVLCYEKPISN